MITMLDLFCGAGGASMGYSQAGITRIVGVDIAPQPNYPFEFIQADALEVMANAQFMSQFDVFHASPPCQGYSTLRAVQRDRPYDYHVKETRLRLRATRKPYVIENVPGAPLWPQITLCGTAFGLPLQRHRIFESNVPLEGVQCFHDAYPARFIREVYGQRWLTAMAPVYGSHTNSKYFPEWCDAMGIHWMTLAELVEAIPPSFTEHIGNQLLPAIG